MSIESLRGLRGIDETLNDGARGVGGGSDEGLAMVVGRGEGTPRFTESSTLACISPPLSLVDRWFAA